MNRNKQINNKIIWLAFAGCVIQMLGINAYAKEKKPYTYEQLTNEVNKEIKKGEDYPLVKSCGYQVCHGNEEDVFLVCKYPLKDSNGNPQEKILNVQPCLNGRLQGGLVDKNADDENLEWIFWCNPKKSTCDQLENENWLNFQVN